MTLIKNIQVVDGSGKPAFKADVLLKDNKISAIGQFPNKKADLAIDGLGLYLSPGFVDVNTDSDHYLSLFTDPAQEDFLTQGVTTTFAGHCGSSLAPLIYGGLESIRKRADITKVNVDWHSVAEFLKVLGKIKLGVNFGTLVGHGTIRRALTGGQIRDLTDGELMIFKNLLRDSLKEGAFGMSTGLNSAHARETPYLEIKELVNIVAENNGVYATHLRNEKEGLLSSIQETLKLADETKAQVLISHLKPLAGFEEDHKDALEMMKSPNVHFDSYPFGVTVVPIHTMLPDWAQVGNFETLRSYLDTPHIKERLVKDLMAIHGDELGDIRVSQAPGLPYLIGKTVRQIAENQNLDLSEALIKLMLLTNFRAIVFHKNINQKMIVDSLFHRQAFVSTNGASLPSDPDILKDERFYNTFPKFLEIINRDKNLSLENAIKKITLEPAKKFGLKDRGLIKENNIADLNLFSFGADGKFRLSYVIVNGRLAVKDGAVQNILAGQVLKRE